MQPLLDSTDGVIKDQCERRNELTMKGNRQMASIDGKRNLVLTKKEQTA